MAISAERLHASGDGTFRRKDALPLGYRFATDPIGALLAGQPRRRR
jgi:hypothetical protein